MRQLLIAALGCNLAWGIIDGIMYIIEPHRRAQPQGPPQSGHFRCAQRRRRDDIIRNEVEPELESLARPEDREAFYRATVEHLAQGGVLRSHIEDG